jgi:hypothetical protein
LAPSRFTSLTSSSNGPTCIQLQGDWFKDLLARLESEGVASFEAKEEAAESWVNEVQKAWEATLLSNTKISASISISSQLADKMHSWWNGGNIPGKKLQPLAYAGGLPDYFRTINKTLEKGYQGWIVR